MKASRSMAAVFVVSLVAAACSGDRAVSGREGGTLRIGTLEGIDSLNPFVGFNQDSYSTWFYMYPSLVQYQLTNYKFVPNFATSWETSADGRTWTFHLAHGAHWSDGKPLTSSDVAWTINTIIKFQAGPTGYWAGSVAHLEKVQAEGPDTVVATYEESVANVLPNLGFIPILPEHVWAQYATGTGKALKTYPNKPEEGHPVVGAGPFTLVQYKPHDVAIFQRNTTFYGTKPQLDEFGLVFFQDPDAMVIALKS